MGQTADVGNGDFGGEAGGSPSGGNNIFKKLLQGGTKGLAQGFSNMQNQNAMMRQGGGGGAMPIPTAQPVSADYFTPQQQNQNLIKRAGGMNSAFYGGGQ